MLKSLIKHSPDAQGGGAESSETAPPTVATDLALDSGDGSGEVSGSGDGDGSGEVSDADAEAEAAAAAEAEAKAKAAAAEAEAKAKAEAEAKAKREALEAEFKPAAAAGGAAASSAAPANPEPCNRDYVVEWAGGEKGIAKKLYGGRWRDGRPGREGASEVPAKVVRLASQEDRDAFRAVVRKP